MRLSAFTDYSLRVLMYLGVNSGRLATVAEIAASFSLSKNHLMKVVHRLGCAAYIETVRGKGGGIRLARPPEQIKLGELIRYTETDLDLVECFADGSNCRLQSACRLQHVLAEARQAMLTVLDNYTLASLLEQPVQLAHALDLFAAAVPRCDPFAQQIPTDFPDESLSCPSIP